MTYIHDTCNGEVELIYPDGCYDDNYGLCTVCGEEGELITVDTDSIQELVLVLIHITCIRD
jgi:hypothetical protein